LNKQSFNYIILLILPYPRAVQEGSLLIDSSTINPDVAKEVASRAEDKGATYLDAPVSGGRIKPFFNI
jgi:3-hydroxyisobutyrate dehydrogenase-like beta-hydroxyacid dehydrogenase